MLTMQEAAARRAGADPDVARMLRVKGGDDGAFAELVAGHQTGVRQQLFLMVGDRDDAEDLAQEVFLRVYRHRDRYRPAAKFVTWLYHIVRNVGRNALRTRRRRPTLPLGAPMPADAAERELLPPDERTEAPSRPMERGELRQVVRTALGGLHRRQRDALFLQQFEDRSYLEIADRLALSPKAAKSLLYRARNQMREALEPYLADA
jgi:RNA polymerase sigma-70 factor (ECF subfamily)